MGKWRKLAMREVMEEFHDGPHATPPPAADGAIYLGIKNITDAGALDLGEVRYIAADDLPTWTRRVTPEEGDVVFTYEATLHRYAVIPNGFHGCLGRRLALIRPDRNVVLPRFLHFAMLGSRWRETVNDRIISGATVDRIPIASFPDFPIDVPDIETQQSIVNVLGAIDDLVENNRRRIELLEQMAQESYREWFVRFRYPGHGGAAVSSTGGSVVRGGPPGGWEIIPVSELLEINPRVQLDRTAEVPFITMGDLSGRSLVCFPSDSRAGSSGSRYQNGDTLLARITPCLENGKTGFVQGLPGDVGRGSTEFIVLRGRRVGPAFTYLLARAADFRANAIKSMSGASGRQRVRNECFDSFWVAAPPTTIAERFERLVEPMLKMAYTLARQNRTLAGQRDLLLPKLITGQIDVSRLDLDGVLESVP
jgi:type I restriction enzyme S subunit